MQSIFSLAVTLVLCSSAFGVDVHSNLPTNWTDCGMKNATLHWLNVSSTPNPVHKGEQQTVIKTGYTDKAYTNLTVQYEQYWRVAGHWLKFLTLKVNACDEHPICPTVANKVFTEKSLHPKLNPLTPFGMYRSKQTYFDDSTGEIIGCVDMLVPYEK